MAQITFDIPDDKIERVNEAMVRLFPIPMIPNPVSRPKDEKIKWEPQVPKFTKDEWTKECVRQWIIKQVARHEQNTAREAIKFNPDDTLIV